MAEEAAVAIRRYHPFDRAAVRRICCDTADAGRPLEAMLGQPGPVPAVRGLFSDLLTAGYTDFLPHLVWVAEARDVPVGYVMGALDSDAYDRLLAWRVAPVAFATALLRGAFLDGPFVRFAWANRKRPAMPRLRGFPAHLHVNLTPQARGGGVGRVLVERFLESAHAAGVPGVRASVREDNAAGQAFFRALGFTPQARRPLFRTIRGEWRFAIIHGRSFSA